MDRRTRLIIGALVLACVVIGGGYVALAALAPKETTTDAKPQAAASIAGARVMVRAVDPEDTRLNGRVFVVEDGKVTQRSGEDLTCERVYYAAGKGLCLGVASSGVEYTATTFDSQLKPEHTVTLTGLPSRARVSSDGRYGAMTLFVVGDSYQGSSAAFSTRTYVVDMTSAKTIAQLEQFDVTREGAPFDAVDFNFWGITFDPQDSNHFYATLGTGEHHYLVEGEIDSHQLRVLRDGVECPSLSPDGKQIAFKSRIDGTSRWRIHVLDVATLADHPVAEKRSIDDQVEWLDDDTLVYSNGTNVYTVPADGSGEVQLLIHDASSPVRLEAAK
jgi:WD40-like Beta Propeller Repeat